MPFIYRIANRTSDDVYYGFTTLTLTERLAKHRCEVRSSSAEVLRCPTAYIELVEEVNEEDIVARERWWIENNPCVNRNIPRGSRKEINRAYEASEKGREKARRYRAKKKLLGI